MGSLTLSTLPLASWLDHLTTEARSELLDVCGLGKTEHDVIAVIAPELPVTRTKGELFAEIVRGDVTVAPARLCCRDDLVRPTGVDDAAGQLALASDQELENKEAARGLLSDVRFHGRDDSGAYRCRSLRAAYQEPTPRRTRRDADGILLFP
jgi:hypothetical protein